MDNGIDGFCIPSAPLAYVNGSLNVALDLWMIMIPLYRVRTLQLHWKHKAGVVIMFLMGTLYVVFCTAPHFLWPFFVNEVLCLTLNYMLTS